MGYPERSPHIDDVIAAFGAYWRGVDSANKARTSVSARLIREAGLVAELKADLREIGLAQYIDWADDHAVAK